MLNNHHLKWNEKGHLVFGGVDTVSLAKKHGTPLFVYDVQKIRQNARAFIRAFQELGVKGRVAYASKAFSSIAIIQIIEEEGLYLDVVSLGELYTAIAANYPAKKVHLHGNNKSYEEIEMAIKKEIGCIVIDNFNDIKIIEQVLATEEKTVDVLLRVTPGIRIKTHEYITTGNEDSKFGFHIKSEQLDRAFHYLHNHLKINVKGIHYHIGSQIFEPKAYTDALKIVMEKISTWHEKTGYCPSVINVGGGFGIRYTKDDEPKPPIVYLKETVKLLRTLSNKISIPLPEIWIEPGRAIVGDAAITLYTVGSIKNIPGVRKYVSVDGGMTDNLRPALYQAKYEGIIANKAREKASEIVSIAGKCCESGDMLVYDLPVAKVETGDIFALFSTGAYGYSMASHYNRVPKPAVVFIENKRDYLVIKRETYHDLLRNDLFFQR